MGVQITGNVKPMRHLSPPMRQEGEVIVAKLGW
jgi:hypothetical protein